MSNVVVDVYLNPFKNTTEPTGGSILFSYVLDVDATKPTVLVTRDGTIYIGAAGNDADLTLTFVLQTKSLEWNGTQYDVTFSPDVSHGNGAMDMLKISEVLGTSPTTIWNGKNGEFEDIKIPTSTSPAGTDAIAVAIHRGNFKQLDYQYSLAVNVYKQGSTELVNSVQDDPQIRDRGIPFWTDLNPYLVTAAAIVLGVTIVILGLKMGSNRV